MPVLVEQVTLLFRRDAIEAAWPGGWVALGGQAEADAACSDGALCALAFSDGSRLSRTFSALEKAGLDGGTGRAPGDLAWVGQRNGPGGWWPWLELARVPGPDGGPVLAARLAGTTDRGVVCPDGWTRAGSATERFGLPRLGPCDRPLRHVGRDAHDDLYLDRFSGEGVRIRRPGPPVRVAIATRAGGLASVVAEVARDGVEREVGLMFREALPSGTGMYFFGRAEHRQAFWMKNTLVPLDLLFLSTAGEVVGVVERAAPLSLAPLTVSRPSRDVLELPAGFVADQGIAAGDRVHVESTPEVRR